MSALNHATPVAPPPGHVLTRSGTSFVLTATAASGATVGGDGTTNVTVTHSRDTLRALALYLLAAAD